MSEAVVPSGSDSAHESALRTSGEVRADYAFSLALGFFANALTVLVLLPLPALTGRKIDAGLAALWTMWFAAPTFLMLTAYTYVRARVPREISDEALGQIDIRSINWRPRRDSETRLGRDIDGDARLRVRHVDLAPTCGRLTRRARCLLPLTGISLLVACGVNDGSRRQLAS